MFKLPKNKLLVTVLSLSIILNFYLYFNYVKTFKDVETNVLETYILPNFLRRYRDAGFKNTFVPTKSPFGGQGMEYTKITTSYLSNAYLQKFGSPHPAIDIVPTKKYYKESIAYRLSRGYTVVLATHNGTVNYLYDENGANYIIVTNPTNTLRTMYVHLKAAYVTTGQSVVAGQPIGIMGSTGRSTGPHVHYAVQTKEDGRNWKYQNPTLYIQQLGPTLPLR